MGKVARIIRNFEKLIKGKKSKKTNQPSKKPQPLQPKHYGAMLEEMVKLLPQKEHQRPVVFFKEYSQIRDQIPQKEEDYIYDEISSESIYDFVTEEFTYNHVSDAGTYDTRTKENFEFEEQKKETSKKTPHDKLLQQHTYENINFQKESLYDQVAGANKPIIPPKPKLTKEFLEEMKQKSRRHNQEKQQHELLNKQNKER